MHDPLSQTFSALADPTRRAILARLRTSTASVGELAAPFDISAPAISRHLRVLERAGLIARTVDRQWRRVQLVAEPLREAGAWLTEYRELWETSFDRLAEHVETNPTPDTPTAKEPCDDDD